MTISHIESLQEEQSKWCEIIYHTEQAKKKTLDVMIQLRKEISSLIQLKKSYPESTQIDERISQCDKLLEESNEVLDEMNKEISESKQQKEALKLVIEKFSEATHSQPKP